LILLAYFVAGVVIVGIGIGALVGTSVSEAILVVPIVGLFVSVVSLIGLVTPSRKALIGDDGSVTFIGRSRSLNVPPGDLIAIRPILLDLFRFFPTRVTAKSGTIFFRTPSGDTGEIVAYLATENPAAHLASPSS
jgi:hypothetical protein